MHLDVDFCGFVVRNVEWANDVMSTLSLDLALNIVLIITANTFLSSRYNSKLTLKTTGSDGGSHVTSRSNINYILELDRYAKTRLAY